MDSIYIALWITMGLVTWSIFMRDQNITKADLWFGLPAFTIGGGMTIILLTGIWLVIEILSWIDKYTDVVVIKRN